RQKAERAPRPERQGFDLAGRQFVDPRIDLGQFVRVAGEKELAPRARIDELAPRKVETLSFRPRRSLGFLPLTLAAVLALVSLAWLHAGHARERRT
ncbi:MAG: hypothetical protein AAGD47_02805, partial [Pseudomonadota bacterium]